MEDLIIVAILVLIIGAAAIYIIRQKKKGARCIGCPAAGRCSSLNSANHGGCCSGNCDCGNHTHIEEEK